MATDFRKVDKLVDAAMADGLLALGKDIKKRAIVLAPFDPDRTDSGPHLRATGKVELSAVGGDKVSISFNKEYAKNRHYNNNKNPSTKLYLTNALKSITNISSYFRSTF